MTNKCNIIFQVKTILLLLLCGCSTANAAWTGISASINEVDSNWVFENDERNAETTSVNLQFEEKTASGIGVGANLGRLTTRISQKVGPRNTEKFDAGYFGLYLRYPFKLGESISISNKLGYRFHSGSVLDVDREDEIEWREISYEFGISARFSNIRVTPFIIYSDISGDISNEIGTNTFENDETVSSGLSLDLFLDPTSYVRMKFIQGNQDSAAIVFAREF